MAYPAAARMPGGEPPGLSAFACYILPVVLRAARYCEPENANPTLPIPAGGFAMITVHLVLNAHIDPVWLWPWQGGMDEWLATCRSACERLEAHPDIVFTRGEAWGYSIVERIDPALFARIRAHVAAGRWEIVGGWWLQPDCNLPSGVGLEKQIALGRKYFESRFGVFPEIGYNVDSFGHTASLPSIMRRAGQTKYVMMRPQEDELTLPARLFRWRGFAQDEGITTFRIAGSYTTEEMTREHVLASLERLPTGVSHTMCFVGIGDHGGGPTERQIAWCRENADAIAGCRLKFSSPSRFFAAVAAEGGALPEFTGELGVHAVGCYSVTRAIKTAVRRAEHVLQQAEIVARTDREACAALGARLDHAWEQVCLGHFHDSLAGTCIASAYRQLEDLVGGASATADEILQTHFRKAVAKLPDDARQRMALFNASDRAFDGYALLSPWTGERWANWRVRDADGKAVPYQLMHPDSVADPRPRVLLRVKLEPAEMRALTIGREPAKGEPEWPADPPATLDGFRLSASTIAVDLGNAPVLHLGGDAAFKPQFELYEDPTDTWGHGVARLGKIRVATAEWQAREIVDRGPLMVSAIQRGNVAESLLLAEWRVYCGEPVAELLLRVDWRAKHKVLKLVLPLASTVLSHTDGIPGGSLRREERHREQPLRDFTLLHLADATRLGVVCPDVFGLEATEHAVSFTLLRSPLMAHHDPAPVELGPRAFASDQGTHDFRFRFVCGDHACIDWLEMQASMLQRPLLAADWTKGMRARFAA